MPKAAALRPVEWATTHSTWETFDIDELNRVVRDHAFIDLATADRQRSRPPLARIGAKAMYWIAAFGIIGPGAAIGLILSGGGRYKFSEDFSVEFETLSVQVASVLAIAALLYLFVPWVRTPYRQWDRSVVGVTVVLLLLTAGLLAVLYVNDDDEFRHWSVVGPQWVVVLMAIAVIVGVYRLHHDSMPPAVELDSLTPAEIQVLRESRREALVRLRSRRLISYAEFDALDQSPLGPAEEGGDRHGWK